MGSFALPPRPPSAKARIAAGMVATAAALILGSACGDAVSTSTTGASSSASSSTSTGAGGSASCGLPPVSDATCEACLETSCCEVRHACSLETKCNDLEKCITLCDFDLDCINAKCAAFLVPPTPLILETNKCLFEHCLPACPKNAPTCKGAVSQGPSAATCGPCAEANCCSELTPALVDIEFAECTLECADPECLYGCEQMFPDAVARATAKEECLFDKCEAACSPPNGCGEFAGQGTCGTCVHQNCCAELEACSKDASCLDLFSCLMGCSGLACNQCLMTWPLKELELFLPMQNCLQTRCESSCGGQGCGLYASFLSSGCSSCVAANCCKESTECGLDGSCAALRLCVELCKKDTMCIAKCGNAAPTGTAKLDAFNACEASACAGKCP